MEEVPIWVAEAAIKLGALTLFNEIPRDLLPTDDNKIDSLVGSFFNEDEFSEILNATKIEAGHGS